MNNKLWSFLLLLFGLCLAAVPGFSQMVLATVPADITELQTDMTSVWGSTKTLIIGFAAFSLLMFVIWKVRKRGG